VNARNSLNRADARAFGQGCDYRGLLVGAEYVCHAYYCITEIQSCQVFLCYNFSVMKILALSAVVIASLVIQGGKAETNSKTDTGKAEHPPQQTVTVVNQQAPEREQDDHAQKPPSYLSRLFSPENLPNIALAIIGILTLGAIWYQAREMTRATEAMRVGTRLQEAGMKQWVDVTDWRGGVDIWKPDSEPEQPDYLMFDFSIVNPTNYPMILKGVSWKIGSQEENIAPNCTLPPKGRHPTIASYDLTPDEMVLYGEKGKVLQLEVNGTVDFEDVLRNLQTQPFWVAFHCFLESGIWITKSYKTAAWVQNPEIQKKKPGEA
jgi:hypothetical protein